MAEFPEPPAMPAKLTRWAKGVQAWCREHSVELVNGAPPSRYPTGTIIDTGCTADSTTGQQRAFPATPKAPRKVQQWAGKVRDWCVEHRVAIVKGGSIAQSTDGAIVSTDAPDTGGGGSAARAFPEVPASPQPFRKWAADVAAWCQESCVVKVVGGTLQRYPNGTVITTTCGGNFETITGADDGFNAAILQVSFTTGWSAYIP